MMNVKMKAKDNMKARMDIRFFYHCKNMELVYDRARVAKLKAIFVLDLCTITCLSKT